MRLSRELLQREAMATGFRVEILEKVAQLLDLLSGFDHHPYLKGRFALKGGTALNLFVFDVPRLSIDVDLNYVGQIDREAMLAERPKVERALEAVCGRAGIAIDRVPGAHAGGKWRLRYEPVDGQSANLALDDIAFEPRELRNQLVPTLRTKAFGDASALMARARSLNDECRDALRMVLPLAEAESEFLDRLLDHGEIVPALLTNDPVLRERIAAQPMLAWKSLNVRRRKNNQ